MMGLLNRVAQSFIMGFGITQPTAAQQKTAAIFIGGLLLTILAFFGGLAFFLTHHFLG